MDKYLVGLIGSGIQQSLSPAMHEAEARAQGFALHYQLIDLDRVASDADVSIALPRLLFAARDMGFAGLNITFPCKQRVLPLLDDISPEARAIGAVNTVIFRDGKMIGENTDCFGWRIGFERAFANEDRVQMLSQAVLLGAGGAGAAIAHALAQLGARELSIYDGNVQQANSLAANLREHFAALVTHVIRDESARDAAITQATGVVNATPIGMNKLPGCPLHAQSLNASQWVSDVVYFPIETELLRKAKTRGCPVMDGGHMAVGQAVKAFTHFTGRTANFERVDQHFRSLLLKT